MRHTLDNLPELSVPDGFGLRPFTAADADAWAQLLAENGELGAWTAERAGRYFAAGSRMPLDGAFFVTREGWPVATAQLHLHDDDAFAPTPELGWVAVHPGWRGRRLGALACLAVLRHARATEHRGIFLLTDDHRLPAIRTYLRLGFRPWLCEPSAEERWQAIVGEVSEAR